MMHNYEDDNRSGKATKGGWVIWFPYGEQKVYCIKMYSQSLKHFGVEMNYQWVGRAQSFSDHR